MNRNKTWSTAVVLIALVWLCSKDFRLSQPLKIYKTSAEQRATDRQQYQHTPTNLTSSLNDKIVVQIKKDNRNSSSDPPWWESTLIDAESLRLDLDFNQRNKNKNVSVNCGTSKCFYPSKSNPGYGYLIGQRTGLGFSVSKEFTLRNMEKGYQLALQLEITHGIRHCLEGPPKGLMATPELANDLNSHRQYGSFRVTLPEKVRRDRLLVQTVKECGLSFLIVKTRKLKRHLVKVKAWVEEQNWNDNRLESFHSTFTKEIDKLYSMLSENPNLYKDFQFWLDPKGQIWHLDFDRAFIGEAPTKDDIGIIHERLNKTVKFIQTEAVSLFHNATHS